MKIIFYIISVIIYLISFPFLILAITFNGIAFLCQTVSRKVYSLINYFKKILLK